MTKKSKVRLQGTLNKKTTLELWTAKGWLFIMLIISAYSPISKSDLSLERFGFVSESF